MPAAEWHEPTINAPSNHAEAHLQPSRDGATAEVQRDEVREHQEAHAGRDCQRLAADPGGDRPGSHARRARLLEGIPILPGVDRDEYPPAVGRGRANGNLRGLVRGINPVGWMADVMYVESSENRSHGSSLGSKLRPFCNGTRFRYLFV